LSPACGKVGAFMLAAILGASRRAAWLIAALAIIVLGGVLALVAFRREDGRHHATSSLDAFERAGIVELKEGQPAPALALATLDGSRASLAEHRDKLVVLNFWATWCHPCAAEMPSLEALWRRHREHGLIVLAVSVDRGSPRGLLEPYVRHLRLTFPILLDPDSKISDGWRVTALPATFLIRPGGDVAGMVVGAREWDSAEMMALVAQLLTGRRGPDGR
jgi:peroxiredoxin